MMEVGLGVYLGKPVVNEGVDMMGSRFVVVVEASGSCD
jgi:hypothetical protein